MGGAYSLACATGLRVDAEVPSDSTGARSGATASQYPRGQILDGQSCVNGMPAHDRSGPIPGSHGAPGCGSPWPGPRSGAVRRLPVAPDIGVVLGSQGHLQLGGADALQAFGGFGIQQEGDVGVETAGGVVVQVFDLPRVECPCRIPGRPRWIRSSGRRLP